MKILNSDLLEKYNTEIRSKKYLIYMYIMIILTFLTVKYSILKKFFTIVGKFKCNYSPQAINSHSKKKKNK